MVQMRMGMAEMVWVEGAGGCEQCEKGKTKSYKLRLIYSNLFDKIIWTLSCRPALMQLPDIIIRTSLIGFPLPLQYFVYAHYLCTEIHRNDWHTCGIEPT